MLQFYQACANEGCYQAGHRQADELYFARNAQRDFMIKNQVELGAKYLSPISGNELCVEIEEGYYRLARFVKFEKGVYKTLPDTMKFHGRMDYKKINGFFFDPEVSQLEKDEFFKEHPGRINYQMKKASPWAIWMLNKKYMEKGQDIELPMLQHVMDGVAAIIKEKGYEEEANRPYYRFKHPKEESL